MEEDSDELERQTQSLVEEVVAMRTHLQQQLDAAKRVTAKEEKAIRVLGGLNRAQQELKLALLA